MANKTQSTKKIRSLLEQSVKESLPLSIRRSVQKNEVLHGTVLEIGKDWILLASLRDGGYLDGYTALRIEDLRLVEPEETFLPVLKTDSHWPPKKPAELDIANLRTIIDTAAAKETLVAVFREAKRPDTCLIGAPMDWGKKSVWLLSVDTAAQWEDFLIKLPFKDITRISFGGDYETALLRVAGAVPSPQTLDNGQ